ncbi:DNA translocase FtsK [Lacticaseibacillus nasuensis]|uniref:DNA translocase FtsK n=1 Tax=Lacticaseibacillus nasuensis TaxID=944671 RepID=UPI002246A95C|nr:DNA translocase FtsK [Lacticaseibacillus nasuensis]MCX2454658.1 DNA translocase FtsK [Lacticaseibacillus nasuensis]
MAQQRRKTTRKPTTKRPSTRKKTDLTLNWLGVVFAVVGVFALGRLGLVGTLLANCFRLLVGNTYLFGAAVFTLFGVWLVFSGSLPHLRPRVLWGAALTYVALLPILTANTMAQNDWHSAYFQHTSALLKNDFALMTTTSDVGGGGLGGALYAGLGPLLSRGGAVFVCAVLMLVGVLIIFDVRPAQIFAVCKQVGAGLASASGRVQDAVATARANRAARTAAKPAESTKPEPAAKPQPVAASDPEPDDFTINAPSVDEDASTPPQPAPQPAPQPTAQPSSSSAPSTSEETADSAAADDGPEMALGTPEADYQLPDMALLSAPAAVDQTSEYNAIKRNRGKLKDTMASFGVDVTVKAATLGPSITQYEIQPATGVKVSKIVNLADDLALALAAKDIRIEAPIPGKSLIGIEVPNAHVATVGYRDVLMHTPKHPDKPLVLPLGKDVNGNVVTFDLTKMPHLLIAGATGSGKSVMINVIITSILMTTKPTEVRLMLIDPKRVELSVYNGVPHLLTPVVTEAKKAPSALNKVIDEMNRRYERFSAAGVRNMGEYNRKAQEASKDDPAMEKMPYIVVIVDELADLMMVAGAEVETAIVRLAQMARAAGIHIIIATQRPSVDVITGLIKANIPSRIAFAVSSGVDSRTILDTNGAERLLGRGDMLYQPMDASKPLRVQGAFIPSSDVEAVVAAITEQVAPAYEPDMAPSDVPETTAGGDSEDELYDDAKAFVLQQKTASTSSLQRRFRIGYNRAARLIDDLEQHHIVGPSSGSKPREVHGDPDQAPTSDQPPF